MSKYPVVAERYDHEESIDVLFLRNDYAVVMNIHFGADIIPYTKGQIVTSFGNPYENHLWKVNPKKTNEYVEKLKKDTADKIIELNTLQKVLDNA